MGPLADQNGAAIYFACVAAVGRLVIPIGGNRNFNTQGSRAPMNYHSLQFDII